MTPSHPMRVRGLKQNDIMRQSLPEKVAPHAGAWIETNLYSYDTLLSYVAPHAGAWIETTMSILSQLHPCVSHPMRVRGLKLYLCSAKFINIKSHPMRVRGLKLKLNISL